MNAAQPENSKVTPVANRSVPATNLQQSNTVAINPAATAQSLPPVPVLQKQMPGNTSDNTGLPAPLKTGIEQLSGISMNDVKVHYHSGKPYQLQALAYAQGTDIHIAPGQEKHLPHEAWHVVQQKQGRVQPTIQMKAGVPVNDDPVLEREADVMGEQAMNNVIQTKPFPNVQFKIGGGYDGENIYLANDTNKIDALTHELGHAALKHTPTGETVHSPGRKFNIDPVKEKEAHNAGMKLKNTMGNAGTEALLQTSNSAGSNFHTSPGVFLPYLTDDTNNRLSDGSIRNLMYWATYRHGEDEGGWINNTIKNEQRNSIRSIPIKNFIDELKKSGDKSRTRHGFLLEMLLTNWNEMEQTGMPPGDVAWGSFEDATKIIRIWTREFPFLNTPGADEETESLLHPEPSSFTVPTSQKGQVQSIHQDQWQAAAVASIRAGWLTGVGFLELKRALYEATAGSRNVIKLAFSRDIIHEAGIQNEKTDIVKVGTVEIPAYATTEKVLSQAIGIWDSSGYYHEKLGIILKSLDTGHKLVDKWENFSHRSKGKQVDPVVDFRFLALLSPKSGSQKVIGANGQVLGDGSYMFTVDPNFRFRYMPAANFAGEGGTAKNFFQFIPHSQLASLGLVVAAGNFVINNGLFVWIDNGSGHYRVDAGVNESNAKATLKNLGYTIAGIQFLNRASGQLDNIYAAGNKYLEGLPEGDHRPAMTPEIFSLQHAMDRMK